MVIINWAIAQIPDGRGKTNLVLLGNKPDGSFLSGSSPLVAYDYQTHEFVSSSGSRYFADPRDVDPHEEPTQQNNYKASFVAKLKPLNSPPRA